MAVILALMFLNSKPLEAARPLDEMKSKHESQDRPPIPPSVTNPCTYIPEWLNPMMEVLLIKDNEGFALVILLEI